MADNKRRGRFARGSDDASTQSIFDLFDPPSDPDQAATSFGEVPVVAPDETEQGAAPADPKAATVDSAGLQPWTEPGTGVIPAVLASGSDERREVKGPSWRGDDPNWTGPELADVFADTEAISHDRQSRPVTRAPDAAKAPPPPPPAAAPPPRVQPPGAQSPGQVPTQAPQAPGQRPERRPSIIDDATSATPLDRGSARPVPSPTGAAPTPGRAPARLTRPPSSPSSPPQASPSPQAPPANRNGSPAPPPTAPPAAPPPGAAGRDARQVPSARVNGRATGRTGGPPAEPRATSPRPPSERRPGRVVPAPDRVVPDRGAPERPPAAPPPAERLVAERRPAERGRLLETSAREREQHYPDDYDDGYDTADAQPGYDLDGDARRGPARGPGRRSGRGQGPGPSPKKEGRSLTQSSLVAIVLAAAVFTTLAFGPVPTVVLVCIATVVAATELFNAMRLAGTRPATLLGLVGAAALPAAAFVRGEAAYPLVVGLAVVFGLLWYLTGADSERPVINLGLTLTGVLWVGGLAGFASLMLRAEEGVGLLLATILIAATSDTLSYLGGKTYGTKSFHSASPNKTWEGTLTGFVGAMVAGAVIAFTGLITVFDRAEVDQLQVVMVLAAVVGVLTVVGDLAESLIKRDLGIKDMGTLLPGHGGMLDRVDGLLFALPGAYYVAVVYQLF